MFNDFSDTLSLTIAKKILGGFEQHYRNIKKASVEAKRCFEEKEWEKDCCVVEVLTMVRCFVSTKSAVACVPSMLTTDVPGSERDNRW